MGSILDNSIRLGKGFNNKTVLNTKKLKTEYRILIAISIAHLINDLLQSVAPSIYPQLQKEYNLSMTQIGIVTLCAQLSASIFQPIVGAYTDKHPMPFSQVFGMALSTIGILALAYANNYYWILLAVVLIGIGASIFHPESSRVANLSSGGKLGFAQSIFQLGGYAGIAFTPLLMVWIILPNGQKSIIWLLLLTFTAKALLIYVGIWRKNLLNGKGRNTINRQNLMPEISRKRRNISIIILLILIISKYFYSSGITNYFQFYTIEKFGIGENQAQIYLFYFLAATAIGTLLGGLITDRLGKNFVIGISVYGAIPLVLALPYANLFATAILIIMIGVIISLPFSAILVYAQQLMPHKVGAVSGLFYGFAFGMSGLGATILGVIADAEGIEFIYKITSFLPILGLVILLLPKVKIKED